MQRRRAGQFWWKQHLPQPLSPWFSLACVDSRQHWNSGTGEDLRESVWEGGHPEATCVFLCLGEGAVVTQFWKRQDQRGRSKSHPDGAQSLASVWRTSVLPRGAWAKFPTQQHQQELSWCWLPGAVTVSLAQCLAPSGAQQEMNQRVTVMTGKKIHFCLTKCLHTGNLTF